VLDGVIDNFPLLLHHRVTRRAVPSNVTLLTTEDDYIRGWNSNEAIAAYANARATADQELWLVLEYVPHVVGSWLLENQSRVDDVVEQLVKTISFLGAHGIVHFDAHFGNVVTDGDTVYLTDFGLTLDAAFDLSEQERSFLARHAHYDLALVIANIGTAPTWAFLALDADDRAALWQRHEFLQRATHPAEIGLAFVSHPEAMTSGPLQFEPAYIEVIERYRDPILAMLTFIRELSDNPRKDTPYDDDRMRDLLEAAGATVRR
jgi:serine/threonine protein kinase